MPRRFTEPWSYVTAPISSIPGAAGTAQPGQIIMPSGGGYQDPMSSFVNSFAENFLNQAAQQKAQKQYGESVKGIGEYWPILQSIGMTEGQVNAALKAGMKPEDIMHFGLTEEAKRSGELFTKGLDWTHENWTHKRDISEKAFTPDQMDAIDAYKSGKISLSDAMRQSGLSSLQLKSGLEEATAGEGLRSKPFDTQEKLQRIVKSGLDIDKERLLLKDLPDKLKQEATERLDRIKELKQRLTSGQDDAGNDLTFEGKKRLETQYAKELADYKSTVKPTKVLTPELQKQSNNLKGLATSTAMYNQAKKLGLDVRKPNKSVLDLAGLPTGKDEAKDSYYKDVILPALQNKQIDSVPATGQRPTQSYNFPKSPYGQMAPKLATSLGIDPNIFGRLIQQESGWNPNAKSGVGAFGLGQFMPGTAKQFGYSDEQLRKDPMLQLGLAASYFKQKLNEFGGDYAKALAAYNAGSGAVHKYNGIPPYAETQAYVRNILGTDYVKPASKPSQQNQKKSLDEVL